MVKPIVDALSQQNPQQVKAFADAVLPEPPAPPAELEEVGNKVQGAVEQVASQLKLPAPPAGIGEVKEPAGLRMLTVDDADAEPRSVVIPIAANPQLAPAQSAGPERAAAHDTSRAPVAESPRLAPPVGDAAPELPALPRLPLPMPLPVPAPAGACTSCGGGGSGNDDFFGVALAHAWPFPASGFATSQALRLISQHVSPAAGEQPGVTPD
ncbi:hypothetical protein [Kibdelosporangium phytohabitans]|uniref:hypothetical protein n=1 Tax=Kibdelosporangium phytohabitans TaxID=860235 RepID=UPI0012FC4EB4|nr:hypothetical protein [Kibdelosporangium phytohabitans]